ncbi:fungal-specific transcription factor domain-containing protein [Macrophomina phaseolina]|uniref:Fungal-specific transcription factor domain-containing protein n=1 Tax=Macrophomina phaseolina TaxID=35725 RepID=A0ABQ8FVR6_9PEZI|nr:fungal-specific transcription factor domain-containing protein [Macrophomina phaseolina]
MPPRRPAETGDDSDVDRTEGSSKRRRIALACSTCRCRKSRCDGKRPKCSGCETLGFQCSYVQSSSSSNVIVGKEYLSDLEARLERVESRLLATENGRPLSPPNSLATVPPSQPQQQREESEAASSDQRIVVSSAITFQYNHCSDEAEGATDGIGSLSFADEEDAAFLGPSSNIAFMRHLGPALARISPTAGRLSSETDLQRNSSLAPSRALEGDMVKASRRASLSSTGNSAQHNVSLATEAHKSSGNNAFSLPPDAEVRRLMDAYFSNTGLLFPFIHEGTFRQRYEEMRRKGANPVQKTWLALLNIVLAFGISTSSDASYLERQKQSDVFYRRSIALCREQMLRASNLETVQLQLLTSQYLQGSHKSLQTWMVHGLAVKGALQLGLHCQHASAAFTPVEREYRKRVWYGCIILDSTLSMTFGRPPSIPQEYIKIDMPAPEPPLPSTTTSAVDHRSKALSLLFFNATISLYAILNQAITRCYDSNLGCATATIAVPDTINRVYALETQLQDWKANLPSDLHLHQHHHHDPSLPPSPASSLIHTRFTTVLALRFLNLRILIHRPVLTSILDATAAAHGGSGGSGAANPLLQQIGAYNLNCCLESSLEIIAIVRAAVLTRGGGRPASPLGAWWFTLYYTFNAALVIAATLVIRLRSSGGGGGGGFALTSGEAEAREALEGAIEALGGLDEGNRMVEKCRRHLSGLVGALAVVFAAKDQSPLENFSSLLSPPTGPATADGVSGGREGEGGMMTDLGVSPFGQFGTSPMGLELGEFMTDMDAEILNLFFS